MPELPEVETTRRGIIPHIKGQTVSSVIIRQPKLRWPITEGMELLLTDKVLNSVRRRGKYLLLDFDHGTALIHLGMSGSIRILDPQIPIEKHDHFDIQFNNNKTLRYNDPRRFGAFLWAGEDAAKHKLLASLGVEPLEDDFDSDYIYRASRKRTIAVKQFIMDGKLVVGVGNIYANEALFLAGIHPDRAANRISLKRYKQLVMTIKSVLSAAIKQGGTTLKDANPFKADGKMGYFAQELKVYGRAGEPCTQCDSVLLEIRQSGRTSVFCKHCQR